MHRLTRRSLLRHSMGVGALATGVVGAGAGVSATGALLAPRAAEAAVVQPFARPLQVPPVLTDEAITLVAAPADVQILPGAPTRMWTFNGTFPGPTIRRPSGQTTTVTVQHRLPEAAQDLTIHHHGSHTASIHDGLPERETIAPGTDREYVYDHFEDGGPERAALQWYHDHSHHRTSFNSYMGLGGFFILDDEVEAALPLPRGDYELPLFLTDRTFTDDNQLDLSRFEIPVNSREGVGATLLVNGVAQPYADVEPRRYRLRAHNGAGFALYNLKAALTGSAQTADVVAAEALPLLHIGTEAGLLPTAVERDTVLLGPAERAELIIDFTGLEGRSVVLATVPRTADRPVLATTRLPGDGDVPASGAFLQFRVGTTVTEPDPGPLPAALRPLPEWTGGVSQQPDRVFVFGRGVDPAAPGQTPHTVNGRPFDHERVDATPELDSTETWMLLNASQQSHYIHLHDVDWLVLSRNGAAPAAHEAGLKETFKLDPGEYVLIATTFTDHLGPYMIHCHMLDHEDSGMMTTFEVVEPGAGQPTTLTADEQRRTDAVLAAMRTRPGRPAPASLLRTLERGVTITGDGSPYRCTLA